MYVRLFVERANRDDLCDCSGCMSVYFCLDYENVRDVHAYAPKTARCVEKTLLTLILKAVNDNRHVKTC